MLCMGALVAFSALSFAQTDVTNKVLNPDAEKGMLGWDVTFIDGGQIWNKQTKGETAAPGYYGFDNWAFENWRNAAAGLSNSSIFQVINNLPNGTYVFGAYAMATNDSWEPSIETIEGVSMFANEYSIRVATHRVEGMNEQWAYSMKFNVATTVTDGTLKIGMQTENANANFVAMDNVTLYYFEEMDHATALEEMAKIDIAATVKKVTPFLEAGKMNADTLAVLKSAIEAAANVTAETAQQIDADLYWGRRQAKKSITDYSGFAEAIATAKEIAGMDWNVDFPETAAALESLNQLIAEAEAAYEEALAGRDEINNYKQQLAEAAAVVELDGIFTLLEVYTERVDSISDLEGDNIGEYTEEMIDKAEEFLDDIDFELSLQGEISASEIKENCKRIFAKIQEIIDNPLDYAEFPIILTRGTEVLPNQSDGYVVLDGAFVKNFPAGTNADGSSFNGKNDIVTYESKLYRFRETLTKVRFIVRETGKNDVGLKGNMPNFCLGSFKMYDEYNNEIPLTLDNVRTNACQNTLCPNQKDGSGIPGLIDNNPNTYFHSAWNYDVPEHHYLEVTLPEGEYSAFRFMMAAYSNRHSRNFPAVLEITYVSDIITELQQTIFEASKLNPIHGTTTGFFNIDLTPFRDAIAEGQELLKKESPTDAELKAAIAKIKEEQAKIEQTKMLMPEAGKKYRIVCGEDGFMTNQNIHKVITIVENEDYGKWLWWNTADPDSVQQEFTFEAMDELGEGYFAIKNEKYGLYVGEYYDDFTQQIINNKFVLTEEKTAFKLQSLGYGLFAILREGHDRQWFHACDHNSGVYKGGIGGSNTPGSVQGATGPMITWAGGAYDPSSWAFRELQELPFTAKSISDIKFQSESISLYEGINTVVLTADKECAFENLVVTNILGKAVDTESVKIKGNVATVELKESLGELLFSFDNAEGVAEVILTGSFTNHGPSAAFTQLQNTYNTVLALAPVQGTEVGQVTDLTKYNEALTAAEALLAEGGSDEVLAAATAALEAAQAGLAYNAPKADVEYLILLGIDAIKVNHLTDMAVFADADTDNLRWTYVSLTNPAFRWKFIDCGETKHGQNAYYIQSAESGLYVTRTIESAASVFLVEDTTETRPYCTYFLNNGKVALADSYWENGTQCLHPNSHGNGASGYEGHRMITWGKHDAASAMRIVEAEKYINDVLLTLDIEDVEVADEFVAPAVKGIYDLFGRRIDTPVSTGIYIIDGKKRVIKK